MASSSQASDLSEWMVVYPQYMDSQRTEAQVILAVECYSFAFVEHV